MSNKSFWIATIVVIAMVWFAIDRVRDCAAHGGTMADVEMGMGQSHAVCETD